MAELCDCAAAIVSINATDTREQPTSRDEQAGEPRCVAIRLARAASTPHLGGHRGTRRYQWIYDRRVAAAQAGSNREVLVAKACLKRPDLRARENITPSKSERVLGSGIVLLVPAPLPAGWPKRDRHTA